MSAAITILHVPSIEDKKLIINCYLVNADGSLRFLFEDEPSLAATGLALLVDVLRLAENSDVRLLKEFPTIDDVLNYAEDHPEMEEYISNAKSEAYNVEDFDLDILDYSNHPNHPDLGALWKDAPLINKVNLKTKIIEHLPMVSIRLEFKDADMLKGIPEGIWDASAYDTDLEYI